jgi:low affinity Fe/Cu permease
MIHRVSRAGVTRSESPARDLRSTAAMFRKLAQTTADLMGRWWAFLTAVVVIVGWALTGPMFGYSDTWQLVINTATTIVTFLMVFLIQNTQNRDAKAIHLKLDELLRGVKAARTGLVDLENLTDEELDELQGEFRRLAERARNRAAIPQHGDQRDRRAS